MEMKRYLIDTFMYNDYANKMVMGKIKQVPEPQEPVKFFSHLINSQNKWMERILQNPQAPQMSWWDPAYALDELEGRWSTSVKTWTDYLEAKTEDQLLEEMRFIGFDGGTWAAKLKDIALQLNYHSIHHRAQIQTMIRRQGLEPDFVDYIGTVYKKLS